jgi:hypothetical protein
MKLSLLYIVIIAITIVSCNNAGNKKTSDNNNEIVEDVSENKTNKTENKIENKETESYYDGFLIENGSLDFLIIGKKLPNPIPDFVSYQIYEKSIMEEGVDNIYQYFAITDNNKEIIKAQISDNIITSITILTSNAKTQEDIGVKSSLEDMCGVYPDIKLFYTYVSDLFFAVTPEYPELRFIISPESYKYDKSDLTNSDMIEVGPQDFDETAHIVEIKLDSY